MNGMRAWGERRACSLRFAVCGSRPMNGMGGARQVGRGLRPMNGMGVGGRAWWVDARGRRHSLAGMNAEPVKVTVNGDPQQVEAGSTVADVVRRWARSEAGVAVAVNDAVVRRAEWPQTPVADGDRVEILTAVQGG